MITTHIPESLIRELKKDFPERLPTQTEYFYGSVAPEQIAFNAGIQHIIHHLEAVAETQKQAHDREEIEILI